jgi:hypothetical protein
MKRLASPVTEYRLAGIVQLAGGLGLGAAAVVSQGPAAALAELVLTAAFVGTWMYFLAYRRFARRAVQEPASAPLGEPESRNRTRRRVGLATLAQLLFLAGVALLTHTPALGGGAALGNGGALMATSRWLGRWEDRHQTTLLREPRWRWSREGKRGWGRGRGMMDPQDFYVLTHGEPPSRTP